MIYFQTYSKEEDFFKRISFVASSTFLVRLCGGTGSPERSLASYGIFGKNSNSYRFVNCQAKTPIRLRFLKADLGLCWSQNVFYVVVRMLALWVYFTQISKR